MNKVQRGRSLALSGNYGATLRLILPECKANMLIGYGQMFSVDKCSRMSEEAGVEKGGGLDHRQRAWTDAQRSRLSPPPGDNRRGS